MDIVYVALQLSFRMFDELVRQKKRLTNFFRLFTALRKIFYEGEVGLNNTYAGQYLFYFWYYFFSTGPPAVR